jgi:hypothetical protein
VGHYLAHHEGMMGGEAPLKSIPQRGQLGAKAAPSQLRQDLRVGAPANQRVCAKALPEAPSTRVATEESFIPAS